MQHTVEYVNSTREELDAKAIEDIRTHLSDEVKWSILLELVNEVNQGKLTVQGLNFVFGSVGIKGRPFHAFCRKYCLEKFKEWLRSDIGGGPVECDEAGFWGENYRG